MSSVVSLCPDRLSDVDTSVHQSDQDKFISKHLASEVALIDRTRLLAGRQAGRQVEI